MSATTLRILTLFLVLGLSVSQINRPGGGPRKNLPSRPTVKSDVKTEAIELDDECPEANGFFPAPDQCDKYFACVEGVATEKLCPDGMVFNDYSPDQEKCDLPYNLDCSKRSKLQTPIPNIHCPRLNGYFGHEEKGVCDKFYYCVDGKFNMITCPDGLVFNPKTGICTWPDESHKAGCMSKDVFEFECPKVEQSVGQTHPRYPDSEDCQFFYVCINGEVPRRNGCKLGQVFDDDQKKCEWARKVPECADWYKDRLSDTALDELENPKPKTSNRTKGPSRRKQPKTTQSDEE